MCPPSGPLKLTPATPATAVRPQSLRSGSRSALLAPDGEPVEIPSARTHCGRLPAHVLAAEMPLARESAGAPHAPALLAALLLIAGTLFRHGSTPPRGPGRAPRSAL